MSDLRDETYVPLLVSESRAAQDLPPRVEDPAALATVAVLLRTASQRQVPEGTRSGNAVGLAAAS